MEGMTHGQRAAIYVRVSDPKQERKGTSLDTQEAAARAYCADRGYVVTEVYRDVYSGADLFDRPQLSELRQAIRTRNLDVTVAYALDRLTRNQAHLGLIVSEMDYADSRLELVTEVFETTPEGKLLQGVKAYAAEIERLKIAERTIRGTKARAERGTLVAGCRPLYGYRWLDEEVNGRLLVKARLEIDPVTSPVVRRIFRDVLAGKSTRSLALALSGEGIPTPMGRERWAASTLNYLLTNAMYTGKAASFRYRVERLGGKRKRVTLRPESDQIAMPKGLVPQLVTPSDFAAVQTRLAENKRKATRNNANPESSLLRAGFARCGYCGSTASVNNNTRGGPRYGCYGWSRDKHQCPCYSVSMRLIDGIVWAKVKGVLMRPELIAEHVAMLREHDPVAGDIESLNRRLPGIAQQQTRLGRAIATLDDDEAAAPLLSQLKALAAEKRQLEADLKGLSAQRAGWQATQDRLTEISLWCKRVAGNLPRLTYAERRDLLTALGVQVKLYRKDHAPRWEISMALDGIVNETASNSVVICNPWRIDQPPP